MSNILRTIVLSVGTYIYALILARLIGKKLISQMNFFDFVIAITFGSLTADIAVGMGKPLHSAISLMTLSALVIILDIAHIKSFRARKILASEPLALISKGSIVNQNMKKSRISVDELMAMLREKNAFSIADVEFAILENDGHLSVLSKADKQPLTPSDMNIPMSSKGLTKDIIIDGNLLKENLHDAGLSENWLSIQLKSQGILDISEVFYAGLDQTKALYVSKRNKDTGEKHGKYGIE